MPLDNDFDDDGNNIVPCPLCGSEYCPSKFDKTKPCPEEENFKKSMPLSNSREVAELKPEGNPNPDCWRCRVGEWPNMHVCEIAPATAKPFTMKKIKKDFQKTFVNVGTLDGEDCYYVSCDAQDMEQFLVKSLKSAFSELMEAVPEKHKMKPTNLSGQMFEAAHNSFRSALIAKGREMGLVE